MQEQEYLMKLGWIASQAIRGRLVVRLEPALEWAFKAAVLRKGLTISDAIRQAISAWLREELNEIEIGNEMINLKEAAQTLEGLIAEVFEGLTAPDALWSHMWMKAVTDCCPGEYPKEERMVKKYAAKIGLCLFEPGGEADELSQILTLGGFPVSLEKNGEGQPYWNFAPAWVEMVDFVRETTQNGDDPERQQWAREWLERMGADGRLAEVESWRQELEEEAEN